MKKYYAGIGSRKTPKRVLKVFKELSTIFENKEYILRSGGAEGADKAFEEGTDRKIIYRPEDATEAAIKKASEIHPNWGKCNDYTRKLMGRNVMIILGKDLNKPVEFVVCWTEGGKIVGGTGFGIRLAQLNDIPVHNFG